MVQSQPCIDCHQSVVDTVTGKLIVDEWKLSHHNTSNAASCADCHDPSPGHPTGCNRCHGGTVPTGSDASVNPDQDGKCNKCHNSTDGIFPTGARRHHFAKTQADYPVGFTSYSASYVSLNYIGNCRKCHNPHDTTSNIGYNQAWADSGHGLINEPSRGSDFKTRGTPVQANLVTSQSFCVRCHTTTGFINFVSSNFLNVQAFGSGDNTRELTGCDACHTDYSFRLRAVPPVTIYYNFSGATIVNNATNPGGHAIITNNGVTYPDLGSSNMCIPCHAGRGGVGASVKKLGAMGVDFTKINSPSAHDLSGAAIYTAKSGYEFIPYNYVTDVSGAGANSGHNSGALGNLSGSGPCITCHLNKAIKSDSHTFKPVIHDTVQFSLYTTNRTWSQVYSITSTYLPATLKISSITSLSCNTSSCHAGALTVDALNSDKEGYISALAALNKWLRLVRYVPVNPQLSYDATANPARLTTKWDYLGSGTGPNLMGAAFNLSALNFEPGAYTHNPLYVKRLIYDSIYFVSTGATNPALLTSQYPVVQQFNVADAIHYLTATTASTLETVNGVANTAALATITAHQADAAITWLYGKPWVSLSASDKLNRPGDN